MEKEEIQETMSVIPQYDAVKNILLKQYYLAQKTLTDYSLKPDPRNEEKLARQSLILLSHSLSFKTYVLDLKDKKQLKYKSYFEDFISNPNKYHSFSLNLIFAICQLILDKLGYFKVENEKIDKDKVYLEV